MEPIKTATLSICCVYYVKFHVKALLRTTGPVPSVTSAGGVFNQFTKVKSLALKVLSAAKLLPHRPVVLHMLNIFSTHSSHMQHSCQYLLTE